MTSPLAASEETVREFLRGSLIAQVATRSAKGRPFMTPLWFVVDEGVIYMTTAPGTRAARNVTRHPEMALLFTGERLGARREVLRLRGQGTCHPGLPSWRVLLRVAAKYYVAPRALASELAHAGKWRLRQRYYGQLEGGFGYLRVVPTTGELLTRP